MQSNHITHEELVARFLYDPETGDLSRRVALAGGTGKGRGSPKGFRLATKNGNGYLRVNLDGKKYYVHRLAWFYIHGVLPNGQIDHINGDRSDNRIANLREATNKQNSENRRIPPKNNTTGYLGVTRLSRGARKVFVAQIMSDGQHIHIGAYATPDEAHAAYLSKKAEIHQRQTLCVGID